jgi:hypothetical protein
MLLICDSYPLFLCLCINFTYFLTVHIFFPWPHFGFVGFDMLFVLSVLLFWIRQPKPCGCVFVFVCNHVLGRSRATQPPDLRLCLLRHFGFLTSPHAIPTRSGCHPNSSRLLRRSISAPYPIHRAHFLHLPTSPRLLLCTSTMTT